MNELTISLDSSLFRPLYEQIYAYLKEEIQNGSLPVAERLPSTRKLSQYLEVSRSTVTLAYEQLLSEGYIENRPGSGYYVNDLTGLYQLPMENFKKEMEKEAVQETYFCDFSPSGVELDKFPVNVWRKISKALLLENDTGIFRLGDAKGEEELRRTITSYLRQARGVRCDPSQVILGAGNDYLLMLLHTLLGEKKRYAFEEYTYKKAADILKILGNEIKPIKMDASGMRVDDLRKAMASIAYVMPSHQYPLGIVMPLKRRMELLSWAQEERDRYIIEDDYDSEFRYKGKPIPALQGYDTAGNVIYLGTFSKSIAPAVRISFMVLPPSLLEVYEARGRCFSTTVSGMDQKILNEFIRGGHYERHLNRMRSTYKNRHDVLLEALKTMQDVCSVRGENAGTHILLTMKNRMTEQQAIEAAGRAGIRVYGLSSYALEEQKKSDRVILGYVNVKEEDIFPAVEKLREVWS